jgi:hypothetical protein
MIAGRRLVEAFFNSTRNFLPISCTRVPSTPSRTTIEIMNSPDNARFFLFGLPIAAVTMCPDDFAERDTSEGQHWDWLGGSFATQQKPSDTQQSR